jgi:hypothetical protein
VKRNTKVLTECAIGCDQESDNHQGTEASNGDAMDLDPEEVIESLCYKHITLILLPNPNGGRDILAMEADLQFIKGHKRNFKRYIIYLRLGINY